MTCPVNKEMISRTDDFDSLFECYSFKLIFVSMFSMHLCDFTIMKTSIRSDTFIDNIIVV